MPIVTNHRSPRFKQVSQGGTDATIPVKTSPSTWKDKESEVPVTVYKGDTEAGLLPATVVTLEHQVTSHKVAPSAKPGKKYVAIRAGTELTEELEDVKIGLGKKASMGEQGKVAKDGKMERKPSTSPRPKQPNPQVASDDINVKSGKFIRQQKDGWKEVQ